MADLPQTIQPLQPQAPRPQAMQPQAPQPQAASDAIIRVRDITVQFGATRVLDGLNLDVTQRLLDEITIAKLGMVGLRPEVADRFPSELSGGMIKRVALARALALDPELVFLDEPTSGLDPIGAGDFDELVRTLQRTLGLTVFMVTHDLDSLYTACDRIAVLGNGKIIAAGSMADMQASQHPWLRAYFHGKRARAVMG